MEIIQLAVKKLSNSMRIFVEEYANFYRLASFDREEAIDNLDRAFESKLEAFHSLYDVSKKSLNYFSFGDTAFVILLRNAVHHRDHLLFRSWNHEMLLDDGFKKHLGAEFLLVDYPTLESPSMMEYFYKLEDFYLRMDETLASPYIEKKMRPERRKDLLNKIESDLYFPDIRRYADSQRYPFKQVYVNAVPIFVSATCRVFRALKEDGLQFKGFDAETYEEPFVNELKVDFSKYSYKPLRIF